MHWVTNDISTLWFMYKKIVYATSSWKPEAVISGKAQQSTLLHLHGIGLRKESFALQFTYCTKSWLRNYLDFCKIFIKIYLAF